MNRTKAEMNGVGAYKERKFFIECIPPKTTHQSSTQIMKTKAGRYFVGKNKRGQDVQNELITLFSLFRPPQPTAQPIQLQLCFHFPWRKSEPKKNRAMGMMPMTTRPDADNLAKGAIDAMQKAGFMEEDSLIYDLRVSKCWSDRTGIDVKIRTIDVTTEGGAKPLFDDWKWS
jgi:Holliday junction resolvase RusA-like endonuclease